MIHEMEALTSLMQRDPDYAWAWYCNLAVPIRNATGVSHRKASEAAAHLMQHMFRFDITKHPCYEYGKSGAQKYAEMRIAADEEEDREIAAGLNKPFSRSTDPKPESYPL